MKETKRALRRHHRQRMIARAMNSWIVQGMPEELRLGRAVRWYNNLHVCSCYMCGHRRENYGPTIQELRQDCAVRHRAGEEHVYLANGELRQSLTTRSARIRVDIISGVSMDTVHELIPRDKMDTDRAEAAVAAGYPAVAPIVPDLLEWLQDMNWPVANVLAPFLASIGEPLVPHIRHIFETDDELWKYWMIVAILRDSPTVAAAFRDDLVRIASAPTEREAEEGLDERAQDTLEWYGWNR